MPDIDAIINTCTNILPGYRKRQSLKATLLEIADALDDSVEQDVYGSGNSLAAFEAEVAALLGKEAAVLLPSGIMAQQIALRIWCERQRNSTIAMHPMAHLEYAEHGGYYFLHNLQRLQFGAPEFLRNRVLITKDFKNLGSEPGVILLELPCRPLGGQLPSWDDLLELRTWATERGIPMHMDGARLWQCRPFYQKEFHEIAALFDSVYVSFYKDIGGLCGAMLLGDAEFIREARVWQVRHGGRLVTQGPNWASAKVGMQRVLPQIDSWVQKAWEVAALLTRHSRISVNPNLPHTSQFQLFLHGDAEELNRRHWKLAQETGTILFFHVEPSAVPGVATTEIHLAENSLSFDTSAIEPFLDALFTKGSIK